MASERMELREDILDNNRLRAMGQGVDSSRCTGAVPEGINERLGMKELSTEMYSKVKEAARRCSKCAEKIWEERNKENEDWVNSKEDLKERKKERSQQDWMEVRT